MTWLLQIILIIISIAFLLFVMLMLRRDRFLLKYSIIWVLLGILGVIAALFPDIVYRLSSLLGFDMPVNFVFLVCIAFLMVLSLVFVAALSRQSSLVKTLIQEVSILKAEIEKMRE